MLLTVSLLNKGSFLGSLINKCRPATVANISLSSPAAAKTLEEKAGLPPKPKKPLTPYFRFMKEQRPNLLASNSKLTAVDVVKAVSKQWQTVDASLKERLQEDYKKEQQQYVEIRTKYEAKLTDEQRNQLKEVKQELTDTKERRMMRRRIKDLGRPKKPASAFLRFVARERSVTPQTSKQTFREWQQAATAKWARLSDEEKSVYMQDARVELEKYKKELSLWEEQMIRLGNIDVVRQSNLIDPPEPRKPRKH